ncbi:transcription antiterminator [Clostridium saccharoperbutylacetonicum N1-4(HMT)]|uniref:Transcription antiterminator n=2 Tax=Clostridium saccharoperbutylacetonicum TaxID=36745 RepID=M1M9V3_9CLOT|nr:transcription antiterminator [Clostridium saccharoperbutylacetonicum N1-4(HMT)]NSB27939.1 beta-glucoside operon transcriptional antiterminator [Clostridium saccharoperbutylacetonicum]
MMVIYKIFNNNAVVIKDEKGVEKIVMGCGLAFKKKCGEEVDVSKIDKVFILSDPEVNNKFQEMMTYIPSEYVELGEEIINYAAKALNKTLNDTIYISLIDHLYAAVKRYQDGISVKNAILWDIKRFYKDEYKIGLKALDMIEERFSVRLPDDEAGFTAIHIVESVLSENAEDMQKITEIISEISNIVKYNFHIYFNEDSVYYYRFVTHLKFFAQRLLEGKTYLDDAQDDLLYTVKTKYVNSYECAEKISKFIKTKYDYDISNDEKLYLTIHIERIVYKAVL